MHVTFVAANVDTHTPHSRTETALSWPITGAGRRALHDNPSPIGAEHNPIDGGGVQTLCGAGTAENGACPVCIDGVGAKNELCNN